RMDGQPINPRYAVSFEAGNSYTFQVQGTGKPFSFNILDSIESVTLERIIPGYSDNVGSLVITIEDKIVQFCDKPMEVKDKDSVLVALDISVGVFVKDSQSVSGRRNILRTGHPEDLAIFHNVGCDTDTNNTNANSSFFLCPTSIICEQKKEKGVALAMVLDRSGSMMDFISPNDGRIRIAAAIEASTQFVDRLGPKDEAMIISFSDFSTVDQTWTNNKFLLRDAINKLNPNGFTAMNEAVIRAIDSVRKNPNPNRAIILLSDGGNNRFPDFSAVVNKIKEDTINPLPIYSIAFGLNKLDPLDAAGLADLKEIARLTKGKTFEVYSSASLDSVYNQLTREVINDRCCIIRVPVPPCKGPCDTLRTIKVLLPVEGKIEENTITYKPTCIPLSVDESNVFVDYGSVEEPVSQLMPNPSNGNAVLAYEVTSYGTVSIEIYSQEGSLVRTILNASQDQGRYRINLDLSGEPQGYYSVITKINGMSIMRPMIIAR
ncbi:MAG: VWA domain-containing protein, partial [Candidatus Kapaibacteriota bacterium]